ncbi:hypothetical protein BS47DRAFT_461661 [Hydnum rufescens UP504]|uniref:RING-type domain-containing protein n=1 Tax=Hydnum rufescens UP504 TaxID=1448309 RepID=A0A9P6AJQ7_9AGAM|nr:hypothetical protein BS47DRAFT_461661 [Hydnum rufescens UP504]
MLYCYVWLGRMAWRNLPWARPPTVSHNNDGMQQVHRLPSGAAPSPMPSVRARSQPRQPLSTTPVSSLPPLSQIVILPREKLSLSSHAERSGTEINRPETHIADSECPICFEDMTVRVSVASSFCGHQLCQTCRELVVSTAERNGTRARCHACRAPYCLNHLFAYNRLVVHPDGPRTIITNFTPFFYFTCALSSLFLGCIQSSSRVVHGCQSVARSLSSFLGLKY